MRDPVAQVGAWLQSVLNGSYQYDAIPGNLSVLSRFRKFPDARFDAGHPAGNRCPYRDGNVGRGQRMLTARAAIRATVAKEIMDCTIIITLAHRDSTGTSVGENAVLVLKARKR